MTTSNIILAITTTTTALITGLLYAYSCSVNPGLGRLPDAQYLAAMQSINKAIQNPLFFISFIGTVFLLPLSAYWHYSQPMTMRFGLLLAAALVYLIGVIGVTALGNIPLNNALESVELSKISVSEIQQQRVAFEKAWNSFHTIRTVASIVALILTVFACLNNKN